MKNFIAPALVAIAIVAVVALGSATFVGVQYLAGRPISDIFSMTSTKSNLASVVTITTSPGTSLTSTNSAYVQGKIAAHRMLFDQFGDWVQPESPQAMFNGSTLKLVPTCGAGQYLDVYGGGTCLAAPATPVPQIDSLSLSTTVVSASSDPYCPPLNTTGNVVSTSATGQRTVAHGVATLAYNSACIIGEASRVANYVNPWQSLANLAGFQSLTPSPSAGFLSLFNISLKASNLCMYPVPLQNAKNLQSFLSYKGISNDFMNNSRLFVAGSYATDLSLSSLESYFTIQLGDHMEYYWNGSLTTQGKLDQGNYNSAINYAQIPNFAPSPANDWTNPGFKALFQNYQLPSSYLMKCLDNNFVSNYPQWSSHFVSAMSKLRTQGLVQ